MRPIYKNFFKQEIITCDYASIYNPANTDTQKLSCRKVQQDTFLKTIKFPDFTHSSTLTKLRTLWQYATSGLANHEISFPKICFQCQLIKITTLGVVFVLYINIIMHLPRPQASKQGKGGLLLTICARVKFVNIFLYTCHIY